MEEKQRLEKLMAKTLGGDRNAHPAARLSPEERKEVADLYERLNQPLAAKSFRDYVEQEKKNDRRNKNR
jgi:hypothetical protein